jgi:nickel/cobalt transporter (NicO) family protein
VSGPNAADLATGRTTVRVTADLGGRPAHQHAIDDQSHAHSADHASSHHNHPHAGHSLSGHADHDHDHADHGRSHDAQAAKPYSRRGLVAMGVAGGLVPSPSALIILLSAIALGRTAFGALLVIAYGLGMAATLTLAGIALVLLRNRYQDHLDTGTGRIRSLSRRWLAVAPYATSALVIVVGIGLTIRSTSML